MKCEKCNQHEATFFYQTQINGHASSLALCHTCAAEAGLVGSKSSTDPFAFTLGSFPNLLGDIFAPSQQKKRAGDVSCPACGATWSDLAAVGKVGCPDCYRTFAEQLSPSIRAMHGNATHTGRAPAKAQAARDKHTRTEALKKELKAAIESENFEKAATLRDEIRALQEGEV